MIDRRARFGKRSTARGAARRRPHSSPVLGKSAASAYRLSNAAGHTPGASRSSPRHRPVGLSRGFRSQGHPSAAAALGAPPRLSRVYGSRCGLRRVTPRTPGKKPRIAPLVSLTDRDSGSCDTLERPWHHTSHWRPPARRAGKRREVRRFPRQPTGSTAVVRAIGGCRTLEGRKTTCRATFSRAADWLGRCRGCFSARTTQNRPLI